MVKEWTLTTKIRKPRSKKEKLERLALEFKITKEQMRGSTGELRKRYQKDVDRIVREYKKLSKVM